MLDISGHIMEKNAQLVLELTAEQTIINRPISGDYAYSALYIIQCLMRNTTNCKNSLCISELKLY